VSAQVITEPGTGRSRGFGFVEFASPEEAGKAIEALNGKEIEGRALVVNEAREQNKGGGGRGGFRGERSGGGDRSSGGPRGGNKGPRSPRW
jgi:RNA recognition motif-containing protein